MTKARHETHLISARPVLATLAVVVLVLVISLGVLYLFYRAQFPGMRPEPQSAREALETPASHVPFDRIQQQKLAHLNSYGWVDAERDIAHIPIDRAMQLVLANHLEQADTAQETGGRP